MNRRQFLTTAAAIAVVRPEMALPQQGVFVGDLGPHFDTFQFNTLGDVLRAMPDGAKLTMNWDGPWEVAMPDGQITRTE